MMRVAESCLVAIVAVAALLGCDDGESELVNAQFPGRRSFDDGRELFFSKAGRDVKWLSWALDGRRVRTFDVPVRDGLAEVTWDLTTSAGARVAPGVYIYRVSAGGLAAAKKCVVH